VVQQWNDDWYAMQALRPPFRDYIANRAAEWALRQAAETCDIHSRMSGAECAAGIRAMISPEGKLKGGESDGQG
jgi:hypothetical protein